MIDVPALDHELLDNAVECRPLVAEALLAGSEGTEVLSSLGDGLAIETNRDAAELLIAVGDIEVDLLLSVCRRRKSCKWRRCGVAEALWPSQYVVPPNWPAQFAT